MAHIPNKSISILPLALISGLAVLALAFLVAGSSFLANPVLPAPIAPAATSVPAVAVKASVLEAKKKATPVVAETRLKITKIGVNAVIKNMGVTSAGAMAVPNNQVDVGRYGLGTRPGETGSAVIGGHNFWDSGAGVFANLNQLEPGDLISVVDAQGVSISFVVRETRTYDATDTNSGIFQSAGGVHLNLITCSGVWNPATQTFTQRLVVFTDVVPAENKIALVPIAIP
jgi:LPXTG-site transpeptidase (sortase) family protein